MSLKPLLIRISAVMLLLFLLVCGVTLGVIYSASHDLPSVDALNRFEPYLATEIFSSDGQLIGKVFSENREMIPWNQIPLYLREGVVAVEDSRFYSHFGVDIHGIIRAAWDNFMHKGSLQGASTITQQLARNLFLSPEVSLTRKIKEALLAVEIERRFSKDEILNLYLNLVYFGAGSYGAQSAAQIYFGKDAKDLNLAECAMLAGLPQAPSLHNPFTDMPAAKARQKEVLQRMVEQHYIAKEDARLAYAQALHLAPPSGVYQGLSYPYFTTYVVEKLFEKYPASLVYKGGLKVYTTLNIRDQQIAQEELRRYIDRGKREHMRVSEGALIAVEPQTGFIRAMVGGYRFSKSNQFDRAWQARRQPGSSFKIFVYSCALDHGFTPDTAVEDSPVSYPAFPAAWSPHNDDLRYWGTMTVRKALAYSRNVVAVKVAAKVGIENVIEYAHRMGVDEPLDPYLPTAIGASVVTPLEMVTAASTLANEGIRVNPTAIELVKDRNGNTLEDDRVPVRTEAISAQTARLMTNLLQDVIKYGTGTRANIGRPAAGKTGTASDFRDAWFAGYTPDLACVVWTGNDNFSRMVEAYGGYLPAMTWAAFMKQALKGVPPHKFTSPDLSTNAPSVVSAPPTTPPAGPLFPAARAAGPKTPAASPKTPPPAAVSPSPFPPPEESPSASPTEPDLRDNTDNGGF